MPYDEFSKWMQYFKERPVGWRDDDRTAKLLNAQGVNKKPWELFDSLSQIRESQQRVEATKDFNMDSFKRSGFFGKIQTAKGGKKLDL